MTTPHINTLREHLMQTLASLRDRENPMEPDRARAIERALHEATTQDVVLVAGKGHEDYQILGTTKVLWPFYVGIVISSIGTSVSPFKEVTLLSTVTRSLVKAMAQKGVRRLVCITGLGAGDSRGHGGFVFDNIIMPLLLRKVYDDKNRQEDLVRASGLDWVLVRPVVLNDKGGTGKVRAATDLSGIHGGSIARADVAQFVVDQLTEDRWLHHAPLIRE